jgi:hypothetical protein
MSETNIPSAIALKNSVKDAVADADKAGAPGNVRSKIVVTLRDREVTRRIGVLTAALSARDAVEKALKSVKPSRLIAVNEDTGKETFAFSSKEVKERNQHSQKLAKLDAAIDAAISTPTAETYATLQQVTEKVGK